MSFVKQTFDKVKGNNTSSVATMTKEFCPKVKFLIMFQLWIVQCSPVNRADLKLWMSYIMADQMSAYVSTDIVQVQLDYFCVGPLLYVRAKEKNRQ